MQAPQNISPELWETFADYFAESVRLESVHKKRDPVIQTGSSLSAKYGNGLTGCNLTAFSPHFGRKFAPCFSQKIACNIFMNNNLQKYNNLKMKIFFPTCCKVVNIAPFPVQNLRMIFPEPSMADRGSSPPVP
jgi:hypothetical protein